MFITLEGPEGSGKTSHIPYLVEYLREKGYTVFPTREPGGTSISEQIRDILHDLKNAEMHPRTETLLYQAARAQIVEQVIKPRLAAGEIVISDRYFDSTIAYQGYGHQQDLEQVRSLVRYATGGLNPDLTILLDCEDVAAGVARLVAAVVHGPGMLPENLAEVFTKSRVEVVVQPVPGQGRADHCHKHDRVLDHQARIELAERGADCGADDGPVKGRDWFGGHNA